MPLGLVEATYRDLGYTAAGHPAQRLDLFVPANPSGKPPPLLVVIHGGGFMVGDKADEDGGRWRKAGYAVASLNYRLSREARWPAQIQDCKAAVRFLRANAARYGFDPNRFGAWGPSAGGHLVAMLGTTGQTDIFDTDDHRGVSSRVQAVADFFGPTDFLQMDAHRTSDGMVHDTPTSPESLLIGGLISQNPQKVASANPIAYLTAKAPPFLVVHGDRDPLVPHHQSELLVDALRAKRIPVTFYTVKGGGHGGFKDKKVDELTDAFFARLLKI
jgi:acetyl esterase/lipase